MSLGILFEDHYRNDEVTPGFEGLAAAFFGGEEVFDLEHYESKSNQQILSEEPTLSRDGLLFTAASGATNPNTEAQSENQMSKSYTITKLDGDWTKVLEMTINEELLKDGPFAIFLTDLVMNFELEMAARRHTTYCGLRVYSQTTEIQNIEKNFATIEKLECIENLDVAIQNQNRRIVALDTEREDISDSTGRETTNNTHDSTTRGETKSSSSYDKEDLTSPATKVEIPEINEVGLANNSNWFHEERMASKRKKVEKKSKKKQKKGKPNYRKQINTDPPVKFEEDDSTVDNAGSASNGVDISSGTSGIVSADLRVPSVPRNLVSSSESTSECDTGEWSVVQPKSTRKTGQLMHSIEAPRRYNGQLGTKEPLANTPTSVVKPVSSMFYKTSPTILT